MNLPDYISVEEVQRVCSSLGLADWSTDERRDVTAAEARLIWDELRPEQTDIELEQFREGLEVELEHGRRYPDANITNNHPLLTGMIVLAHMKESTDYYRRLRIMELEGDIARALRAQDFSSAGQLQLRLNSARAAMSSFEPQQY